MGRRGAWSRAQWQKNKKNLMTETLSLSNPYSSRQEKSLPRFTSWGTLYNLLEGVYIV